MIGDNYRYLGNWYQHGQEEEAGASGQLEISARKKYKTY